MFIRILMALSLLFLFSCNNTDTDETEDPNDPAAGEENAGADSGAGGVSSPAQLGFVPVCDRSPAVRDAILDELGGWFSTPECGEATEEELKEEVTSLDLSDKELSQFKPGDLTGLTALTELDMSSNQFTTFPKEIQRVAGTLEQLSASNNQLTGAGGWPVGFSKLTIINLSNNKLSSPPAGWLKSSPNIKVVNLRYNSLSPADIQKLETEEKEMNWDLSGWLGNQQESQ